MLAEDRAVLERISAIAEGRVNPDEPEAAGPAKMLVRIPGSPEWAVCPDCHGEREIYLSGGLGIGGMMCGVSEEDCWAPCTTCRWTGRVPLPYVLH
jgi:hypothetical protein